jgi:putative hydrolase of the HAD superfamily
MIRRHGVTAATAAMFEDMPMNLAVPHDLGMTTVLVHSSYLDHPVQEKMKTWTELPDHIHHMTLNLHHFLTEMHPSLSGSASQCQPTGVQS